MKDYIGCSGFFYYGWKGRFYPPDLKPNQWFTYYATYGATGFLKVYKTTSSID